MMILKAMEKSFNQTNKQKRSDPKEFTAEFYIPLTNNKYQYFQIIM